LHHQGYPAALHFPEHDFRLYPETGTVILLPAGTTAENENLIFAAETQRGVLFQAVKPGITRVFTPEGRWAVLIRIMRYQYHGLGRYRHFSREDGDDE
jgi:hypothetical protein